MKKHIIKIKDIDISLMGNKSEIFTCMLFISAEINNLYINMLEVYKYVILIGYLNKPNC